MRLPGTSTSKVGIADNSALPPPPRLRGGPPSTAWADDVPILPPREEHPQTSEIATTATWLTSHLTSAYSAARTWATRATQSGDVEPLEGKDGIQTTSTDRDDDLRRLVEYCIHLGIDLRQANPEAVLLVRRFLCDELPDKWHDCPTAEGDNSTQLVYYYNAETGEAQWEHPRERELITKLWFESSGQIHREFPLLNPRVMAAFAKFFSVDVTTLQAPQICLLKLVAFCPLPHGWRYRRGGTYTDAETGTGSSSHPMDGFFARLLGAAVGVGRGSTAVPSTTFFRVAAPGDALEGYDFHWREFASSSAVEGPCRESSASGRGTASGQGPDRHLCSSFLKTRDAVCEALRVVGDCERASALQENLTATNFLELAFGGDYETLRESHLEPLLREALRYVGSEESFDKLAGCDRARATSEETKILQLFELCREALACWSPQLSRWTEKLIENRTSKILENLWTADGESEQERKFTAFDRAIDALENGQENPSAWFENIDMTGCLEAYFPGASIVTRGICDQFDDDEMEAVLRLLERLIAAANKW
ncbi:hypothetical protein FOZ61_007432 [Perkinsus olseni]|uniref:WW domain-containing protein n=1 Tax=Perkinsus olseni TaxID=32597 RepID=A0A7J6L918_PEROL|nr:hypothetical protein FOZ61_007432 [Perkinsus olseni]KAF4662255.1 hypothetical protein FOL46_005381 [Perkinsus olseni]